MNPPDTKRRLLGTHQGSVDPVQPAQLRRRVRVPLQPPPLSQPGAGALPRAQTSCQPQARALPGSDRQPETPSSTARATDTGPRASAEPGALSSEPPMENS
jgi:hypothetical protein